MTIRTATPEDAEICGQICYDAFYKISTDHNFPPDFPSPSVAADILRGAFSHPGFYCVVAEQDGRIVGSNCLTSETPLQALDRLPWIRPSKMHALAGNSWRLC